MYPLHPFSGALTQNLTINWYATSTQLVHAEEGWIIELLSAPCFQCFDDCSKTKHRDVFNVKSGFSIPVCCYSVGNADFHVGLYTLGLGLSHTAPLGAC